MATGGVKTTKKTQN